MPADKDNVNAVTHGVYSFLATGRLPKGCGYLRRQLGQFRRALEVEIEKVHGEICLLNAAYLTSAVRHEARVQLLTRWLRTEEGIKLAERVGVLREIGAATDRRDACLKALNLGYKPSDPYVWEPAPYEPPAPDEATEATAGQSAEATEQVTAE